MRKNANPITTIFFIIFIILFSLFNYEEYSEFHQTKSEIENKNIELNANLEKFELEDIREINDLEFYYTPNKELLTRIVELINNAENEIFLEVYMLTEKRIQESLIKAHNRWIELKIILEKDPYMAYSINDKAYNKLQKAWIDIIWSSKSNYSFNHSKILIIDDLSIISTGNFSYSTFTKNRDFFIFTEDLNTKNKLKENFYNDYNSTKINIFDNNLIFSPNSSRIKFEKLFDEAERDIKMYFQYLKDDELVNKLINIKKEKNISIEIIIPDTATEDENTIKLKNAWINILVLPKYKMHAKAILVDEKYLFIWSINFSTYSIDRNREIWILIKNKNIIDDFLDIYSQDSK